MFQNDFITDWYHCFGQTASSGKEYFSQISSDKRCHLAGKM